MKKVVFTYLPLLILFQGMFTYLDIFYEMEEIVEVYDDFKLHQIKYDDDFTTFFSKHFGDQKEAHQNQHQKEHEQHQHDKYPQKNLEEKTFDYYFVKHNIQLQKRISITSKSSNYYYKDLFSDFEKQKIFQPPRV